MPSDYDNELLKRGILHLKVGEVDTARGFIERAMDIADDQSTRAEASFWLSQLSADPGVKRRLLEDTLAVYPTHPEARRSLAILDGRLNPKDIIDPDSLPVPFSDPIAAQVERFTCPKCGGSTAYSSDGRSLVCEFCMRREDPGRAGGHPDEKDFLVAMAMAHGHGGPVATQVFLCQGCGAEFILPPEKLSVTCAYCLSPHVVSLDDRRDLLPPNGILPHAFDRRRAADYLVDWVEGHGFTPEDKVEAPRGLYLPVWTFDIGGQIDYRGQVVEEEAYTGRRTRSVRRVEDGYPVHLNDLPVPAVRKLATQVEALLPGFDLAAAKPYRPGYLADWSADVYDLPLAAAALEARSRAYARLKPQVAADLGHVSDLTLSSAGMAIVSFKLVLLPFWMTFYTYAGNHYRVLINGQNGGVTGERPRELVRSKRGRLAGLLGT
ncbi:MAG: hypothetical protein ABIJ39_02310 [Chloroflexota bacterium]